MAGEWEDLAPKSNGGWEDLSPKRGAIGGEGTDDFGEELVRRARAFGGGVEFAGSMASKLPGMVLGGWAGLATSNPENVHKVMEAPILRGYDPQSEFGELAGEALGAARDKTGDLGGDSPALRTANELAFDIGTMMMPLGPRARTPLSRGGEAYVGALKAIDEYKRSEKGRAEAAKSAAWEDLTPGTQGEMPFEAPRPKPEAGPNLPDMMERAGERMDDASQTQVTRDARAGQPDLFENMDPRMAEQMRSPTEALRREREGVPYDDARLDPSLQTPRSEPMDPFRKGDMDFPLRQEALEKDPYVYTLQAEYKKAFENSDYPKMQEVMKLAEDYLKEGYNVSTPNKYTGSMWGDKPTALRVEKTIDGKTFLGKSKLGGTGKKGRRQGGTVDLTSEFNKWFDSPDEGGFRRFWSKMLERKDVDLDLMDKLANGLSNRIGKGRDRLYHIATQLADKNNHTIDVNDPVSGVIEHAPLPRETAKEVAHELMAIIQRDLKHVERVEAIERNYRPKGQEGSVKWDMNPEYRKFKDTLPAALKGQAKQMWKEMNKDGKRPDVVPQEHVTRLLDDIPGLKDWKDEVQPITKTPEELIPEILKEEDLSSSWLAKAGRQVVAGGKLLGYGTQNTIVRYVVQTMDRAIRNAGRTIDQLILNEKTGFKPKWEKLSDAEMGKVWSELALVEGKETLTREQLFDKGLNERQVDAAESLQKALQRTLAELNEARVAIGKKPIEGRLGYIPSRFRGDWTVHVKDAEGNLVHILGAQTRWGANRIASLMREKHPELHFEEVSHEPLHRFKDASDATAGYQSLLEVLADEDPRVAALESTYNDYLKKQAYETLAVKRHFWEKKGVGGAEGFKEWQDAKANAEEGLRSVMNYMDHAAKWVEVNKSMLDLRKILRNEEIQKAQPNAQIWGQGYIDQAMGRSTELARSLDKIFDVVSESTGIGQSLMLKGVRDLKYYMTAMYLGFMNAGFSISQMVQVIQTVPAWMLMLKNKGAEASVAHAYFAGAIDATKGYALGRENMSVLGREAWEYAKEYGIVEPKILEDVKALADKDRSAITKAIMVGNMTYFEKFARTQAFMSWTHFLHSTGRFKMGKELYETAANMTDMTMVDYRGHERPMAYKQLGILGEAASALTTFKHNYYTQLWALSAHHKTGGMSPAAAHLALLTMFGGLMGLPGREELDTIIKMVNGVSGKYVPTTREMILRAPDLMGFGGISYLTGMDFSSKFSAANIIPDSPLAAMFPFAGTIGKVGEAGYEFAKAPSKTAAMRIVGEVLPSSMKGLSEKYFSKDDMLLDKDNLEGKIKRDGKSWVKRGFGLKAMDESRELHNIQTIKEQEKFQTDQRSTLMKSARDALFEGNMDKVRELAVKYQNQEGDVARFVDELVSTQEAQANPEIQRRLLKALESNPAKYKRMREAIR